MNKITVFNKKSVFSSKHGKDFYFLCIRDSEGYSNDQIVNKSTFDAVNPPCEIEYYLSCSGNRPSIQFVTK